MNLFLKPWRLSHWFYQVVKFGIVQYMIIKSLTALAALILEAFDGYCFGCSPVCIPSKTLRSTGRSLYWICFSSRDYASVDCPIDPDEIRDSERRTKVRLPHPNVDIRSGMTIKESMRDVFVGGGEYIVKDVRFTVTQAVEPMEKSITKFNEKLHKISQNIKKHDKDKRRVKDDSCMSSSSSRRVIRGIDDPLLNGSF
ncbi:Protein LAZ1 [Raphanus sativus]|nr:Protein LAZ1 [Raphanus sativus]